MAGSYSISYIALRPFTEEDQSAWEEWVRSVGHGSPGRLITLDKGIRPRVIAVTELRGDDWHRNLATDFLQGFFWHLGYLLGRIAGQAAEVLAVAYEPYSDCAEDAPDPRFTFVGYDIMDREVSFSMLHNRGPFPEAFTRADLNSVGLFQTLDAATAAKGKLLLRYADHGHVHGCGIWALWAMEVPASESACGAPE